MTREWTQSQLDAVGARGGCVIVSAAAGSGKTTVLVERCMRMLTDPDPQRRVDADRIMAVTYTRAAAAELKSRLSKAIAELIRSVPDSADLIRQQRLLTKAQISTVDSFCASLAREYFYLLDIDRNFRVGDEGELNVLMADAMRLTLDTMYAEGNAAFHRIVEAFATAKDDARLEDHILKLYHFVRSHPFPQKWMEERLGDYEGFCDASESIWGRIIRDYTVDALGYIEGLYDRGYETICLDDKLHAFLAALYESDRAFLDRLRQAVQLDHWDTIRDALSSFVAGRFSTPRGYGDNPLKIAAAAARATFRETVKDLQSLYVQSETMCLYDIELLKSDTEQIFRAVTLFGENYAALKKARGIADYSDLEHWAIDLLVDPAAMQRTAVAEEVAARYDFIMVDEYQDANETQDTIFKAISRGESNLFVVGDVKQSIYGFRHAMPELFLRRKNNAVLYRRDEPQYPAKIILERNFRSEASVLAAINDVFTKLMSLSMGGIEYNAEERLYPGAPYDPPAEAPMEFDLIDRSGMEEDDSLLQEARFVADRIRQMVSEGFLVKEGEGYRPVQWGDFAVLLRSIAATAQVFTDVLNKSGVPAGCESGGGFLGAREIMLMTNLLRVINNPALDIELLSTVMSPMFGFDEDDMARIRVGKPKGSLYAAVIADAESGSAKSKAFLDELGYYRGLSVTVPLSKLINTIYTRSSYMDVMTAVDRTGAARNNLRMLLDYARSFEQNTHRGLSAFVAYLDRLTENGSDLAVAQGEKSVADSGVKVMSIHSSKGLEFPVVILANTAKGVVSDANKAVLLHPRYGYAQKRRDPALSASYKTMPYKALSLEINRSEKSEELRVLYVALTRARQKLIIVSNPRGGAAHYLAGVSKKIGGEREIPPYAVRSANSLSDWLTMVAMLHPDGAAFREYAEAEVDFAPAADYRIDCRIVTSLNEEGEDAPADAPEEAAVNTAVTDELRRHAEYVYPFEGLLKLPVKVAASALAHKQSDSAERYLNRPAFLGDSALNAAERGTALHTFMQFADFAAARENAADEIERLTAEGYLTRVQADSIDTARAEAFVNSALIDRAVKAQAVYKEYRFNIRIPARRVNPAIDERFGDESVILQGAVDLAFVEDGELVIVDYKTDRVKRPEMLIDRYRVQLELYREALEQCLGLPVKECIIYSVHHQQEMRV